MAETRVSLGVPAWITAMGKGGPWVLLAAVLVYTFIIRGQEQDARIAQNVAANGVELHQLSETMNSAGTAMHAFVADSQRQAKEEVVLLLEVCVQQAEALKVPGGTQRCFDAARGITTERPFVGPKR
jgi:hypothetical protein